MFESVPAAVSMRSTRRRASFWRTICVASEFSFSAMLRTERATVLSGHLLLFNIPKSCGFKFDVRRVPVFFKLHWQRLAVCFFSVPCTPACQWPGRVCPNTVRASLK
jgi:hypothetical protein